MKWELSGTTPGSALSQPGQQEQSAGGSDGNTLEPRAGGGQTMVQRWICHSQEKNHTENAEGTEQENKLNLLIKGMHLT